MSHCAVCGVLGKFDCDLCDSCISEQILRDEEEMFGRETNNDKNEV